MTAKNNQPKNDIIRLDKRGSADLFVVSRKPFGDTRLSWGARGLLAFMLSDSDWNGSDEEIIKLAPSGAHKLKAMMSELKDSGYVHRYRENGLDGQFSWVTEVYENPEDNPHYNPYAVSEPGTVGRSGFIYLLFADTGLYKIGLSVNPSARAKYINQTMSENVIMLHTFPAQDRYEAERRLHDLFASKRQRGEWFSLSAGDVDYVRSLEKFEGGAFQHKSGEVQQS